MINKLTRNRAFITSTYSIDSNVYNGFMVDIVERSDRFDIWLYNVNTGIKDLMFGLPYVQKDFTTDLEKALEITLNNLPDYIPDYIEEYMTD